MTVIKLCTPVCDCCRFYAFNGDDSGAYVNDGRCEHPDHPQPSEPHNCCPDFKCGTCRPPDE